MIECKWWEYILHKKEVSALAFAARVLADSVARNGCRLTTIEVTFPRMVLAEFNTHRVFSRNSASSRAIPFEKQLQRILDDPFIPIEWGANRPGMQASEVLKGKEATHAKRIWLAARDKAVLEAVRLAGGVSTLKDPKLRRRVRRLQYVLLETNPEPLATPVHKQIVNRLLEPFMWHTVIVTATEWDNFWALRVSPMAQPEIRKAAELMQVAYYASVPRKLGKFEWHLPLIQDDELKWARKHPEEARKVSAGRCARVSYLTHDGVRDRAKDIELCESLMSNGHMSPLEHVGRPMSKKEYAAHPFSGNFRGWHQYRKDVPHEDNFGLVLASQ